MYEAIQPYAHLPYEEQVQRKNEDCQLFMRQLQSAFAKANIEDAMLATVDTIRTSPERNAHVQWRCVTTLLMNDEEFLQEQMRIVHWRGGGTSGRGTCARKVRRSSTTCLSCRRAICAIAKKNTTLGSALSGWTLLLRSSYFERRTYAL